MPTQPQLQVYHHLVIFSNFVYTDDAVAYDNLQNHESVKHLQRYVNEFVGRHNVRALDTRDQMAFVALALEGRRLKWKELIS